MILLDTVALSELRRQRMDPNFRKWLMDQNDDEFLISTLTIGEIQRGITKQRKVNPLFADHLSVWISKLLSDYSHNILPFGVEEALIWGPLSSTLGRTDTDLMIAATALQHNVPVVTRNIKHFVDTGVKLINPWGVTG